MLYRLVIMALCALFIYGSTAGQEAEIRSAVERQMDLHPLSSLRDLYKSFFQDRFGPGHLITDTVAADKYLRQELETAEQFDSPAYEPTGYAGNFYRVNLSLIKDGVIPYDTYFKAFLKSAADTRPMPLKEWGKEWSRILSVIDDMELRLDYYEKDRMAIDSLISEGKYAMSHSRRFAGTYHPHYRIISATVFNAELLPLIKNRTEHGR